MIRNTTRNVALALMSAAVLSACATGGSYVQSDQYGNPTEQQNRTCLLYTSPSPRDS